MKYANNNAEYMRENRADHRRSGLESQKAFDEGIASEWPIVVPECVCLDSCRDYYYASQLKKPKNVCMLRSFKIRYLEGAKRTTSHVTRVRVGDRGVRADTAYEL